MHRFLGLLVVITIMSLNSYVSAEEPLRYLQSSEERGSSAAVIVDDLPLAQTSQAYPVDGYGNSVRSADPAQLVSQTLTNVKRCLETAGSDMSRIVKLNVYVAGDKIIPGVRKELTKQFANQNKPATTFVVTNLPNNAPLAMDAVGVSSKVRREVETSRSSGGGFKEHTKPTWATVCPNGIRLYISGQAEKAETLADATRLTMLSLENTLKFCGRTKADMAHVKCFLTPMKQVQEVEAELEKFFAPLPVPAVSYVEWQSTLPIEIEVVAYGGKAEPASTRTIEFLTPPGFTASPVYSRVARVRHPVTVFIGNLYSDPGADGSAQVTQIFGQLDALLKESGSDFQHLAKATYYVSQDEPSQKLNELRPKYYKPDSPPAASKAQVRGVGMDGVGLTLDMIAVMSK